MGLLRGLDTVKAIQEFTYCCYDKSPLPEGAPKCASGRGVRAKKSL